jgi:uncharacterized protein DUF4058
MPSPFPGMDPYLEDPAIWPDFHAEFVGCLRKAIGDGLPGNYDACINERVTLIEALDEPARSIVPDVAIVRQGASREAAGSTAAASLLEPVTLPLIFPEELREPFIEIRSAADRSLVAVLELLSPANKSGSGRDSYLLKRNAVLYQDVHLIELDLLVGGRRLPLAKPLPPGDYYALVAHSERRPNCDVYAWTVQRPLPKLPIPLRSPDADLIIDLGEVFAQTYERGRYARRLRYGEPPAAPLAGSDRQWAAEQAIRKPSQA